MSFSERPNQALERTADRCEDLFSITTIPKLEAQHASSAVAHLILVRRLTVDDGFTRAKRAVFLVLLIPWSMALVFGVTGSPEKHGLRSSIAKVHLASFCRVSPVFTLSHFGVPDAESRSR